MRRLINAPRLYDIFGKADIFFMAWWCIIHEYSYLRLRKYGLLSLRLIGAAMFGAAFELFTRVGLP